MPDTHVTAKQMLDMHKELSDRIDASNVPSNETLKVMLKNIVKAVEDGFKLTNKKQDETNGNVTKNTVWRIRVAAVVTLMNIILVPMAIILYSKLIDKIL